MKINWWGISIIIFSICGCTKNIYLQLSEAPECTICLCTSDNMQNHITGSYGRHGGGRHTQKIKCTNNNDYELELKYHYLLFNYNMVYSSYTYTTGGGTGRFSTLLMPRCNTKHTKVLHESWLMGNQQRMYLVKYAHSMDWWTTLILGSPHRSEIEKRVVCVSLCFFVFRTTFFGIWCCGKIAPNLISEAPEY